MTFLDDLMLYIPGQVVLVLVIPIGFVAMQVVCRDVNFVGTNLVKKYKYDQAKL